MGDYPDFNMQALLKGLYAGDPKALSVDAGGNMQAILKALYAGSPIGVVADVDGNININLKAQDLEEIINRFKYGAPNLQVGYVLCPTGQTINLFSVIAKGYIYYAEIYAIGSTVSKSSVPSIYLDDQLMESRSWETLFDNKCFGSKDAIINLTEYNGLDGRYQASMLYGYTFESSCVLKYLNLSGESNWINYRIYFALI